MKLAYVWNLTEFDTLGPDNRTERRVSLKRGEIVIALDKVEMANYTMGGVRAQMFLLPSGEIAVSQAATWLQEQGLIETVESFL